MAPTPVVAVNDEGAFKRELSANPGSVICALFYADFIQGKFGRADLDSLAANGVDLHRVAVDVGTDEGEELALALGVGSKLPVVRLYAAPSEKHAVELEAGDCEAAAIKAKIASLPKPAPAGGDIRNQVRAAYASTVTGGQSVLPGDVGNPQTRSDLLGYRDGDVKASADLGLGCGNPLIAAKLKPGEVVLDLGSGAGIDCFIAAKEVGPAGHVIGVDMTPEMLTKARDTASKDGVTNCSFRLGEIEHLPVGDNVINCLISNCVINLSPDKPQVYREMNRVLVPGGRVSISDVLRTSDIPEELKTVESYACWVAGASAEDEMQEMLINAGFTDIKIQVKENAAEIIKGWMPDSGAEKFVTSAYVTATKPAAGAGMRDDVRLGISCCQGMPDLKKSDKPIAGAWG